MDAAARIKQLEDALGHIHIVSQMEHIEESVRLESIRNVADDALGIIVTEGAGS